MKKIILIMTLLILVIGCSDKEAEERISMLEHRITELEMDILCQRIVNSTGLGVDTHTDIRFLSRNKNRDERSYCTNRKRYFNAKDEYTYKYSENLPDDFKMGVKYKNDVTNNMLFDPIYKDFFIEKE